VISRCRARPARNSYGLGVRRHGVRNRGSSTPAASARQCARPSCSATATATFTFDASEVTVWLDIPDDDGARAGDLCERHALSLTPPQGWSLVDRRQVREAAAHELHEQLDAHSPLLARAFLNAGVV
jgi:hypothetical protein